MSAIRAFRLTFVVAAIVEAVSWVLPNTPVIDTMSFVAGYVILGAFGFLAARAGSGYRYVFSRTWFFIFLWFALGMLSVAFDGVVPPDWSPEKSWQALGGYVVATVLFLPVAFASSGLGVLIARLLSRLRHDPSSAA